MDDHGFGSGKSALPEEGFTLVELVVVLLIIAVLLAISIPVFIGAQQRARDRAAQSLAREVLGAAKTVFQIDEDYSAATVSRLEETEPGIRFLPASVPSSGPDRASVDGSENTFIAAVYSLSGRCFYVRDHAVPIQQGGTTFAVRDPSEWLDCRAESRTDLTFSGNW